MGVVIKGDFTALRNIVAGRRVDGTGQTKALTGTEALDKYSYYWNNFTCAAPQDVTLPDAQTLTLGWSVVVYNQDTTNALTVKNYTSGDTIKSIVATRAYKFTCTDISDADGDWHVDYLEESDLEPSERYSETFNNTSDWGSAAGGYYTQTITNATHGRGTSPTLIIEELDGSDYIEVLPDRVLINSSGDVSFRVTEVPDGRFTGRITLI